MKVLFIISKSQGQMTERRINWLVLTDMKYPPKHGLNEWLSTKF